MRRSGNRSTPTARRRAVQTASSGCRVLWRSHDGQEQVEVRLDGQGGLSLRRYRVTASARQAWGAEAYEATLEIAPDDIGELALVLLKAAFADQPDALDALRILCERRAVRHRFAVWT